MVRVEFFVGSAFEHKDFGSFVGSALQDDGAYDELVVGSAVSLIVGLKLIGLAFGECFHWIS